MDDNYKFQNESFYGKMVSWENFMLNRVLIGVIHLVRKQNFPKN